MSLCSERLPKTTGEAAAMAATMIAAVTMAACDGETGVAGGAVVRDSAGFRIVEYAGTPQHDAPFALSAEPVYRHGSGSGDYLFGTIRHGALFPDGGAAIFDAANTEIVVLGPDGRSHELLAGSGQGPSEVGFVGRMFALGMDSLLIDDNWNARFTLFADGAVARTVSLEENRELALGLAARGIDASGRLLMSSASYRRGFPDDWLPGYLVRLDLDTLVPDTVGSYDWVPFVPPDDEADNPFAHLGRVGAAAGRFVHGRSDTPELIWRESDGTVSQIVRWQPEWVYPTDEHWKAFEADLRVRLPPVNPHLQTEEAIEELIRQALASYRVDPDQPLPLFGDLFGDDEGRVWLPEYAVASQRNGYPSYAVISSSGEWLGTVDAPPGLRVLDVAGGRVLGVVKDEMDVESVVVYDLISP
ncbi:MAG: hypothetical protein OXN18_06760 [Gemmatimonadota bacterium]|nr:hypothetical protein [Gemmatimonadota bacterium]